jgi:OTU domain-containing protein 5
MFAMEYILAEKSFFKNFVVGGDVEKYVEYKSQDTVWGDNIELQAFRELYNIPIEVYVYNNVPIKTGLEGNPEKEYYRI